MAWFQDSSLTPTSYVSGGFMRDLMDGTTAFDLNAATLEVRMFKESIASQNPDATETYGAGAYVAGNEVAQIGDYVTATPLTLTTPTLTLTSGVLKWDADDVQWDNVQWADGSAGQGVGIFHQASDKLIAALVFGSNDIPIESVGSFVVSWPSAGIATWTYYAS